MSTDSKTVEINNDNSEEMKDNFEYPKKSMAYKNQRKAAKMVEESVVSSKVVHVEPENIAVLIGVKGRNISLISRHANVLIAVEKNSQVNFVPKSQKSDLDLAHRMMLSMISGGVLRWFNHPSATNKYYHQGSRVELENYISENSDCTLELLRAYNGHLCLIIVPKKDAEKETISETIRKLRPVALEKINSFTVTCPAALTQPFDTTTSQ
jgi:hypothetical protein